MKQSASVFPIPAASAIAWAAGRLSDADILLSGEFPPEAIYIAELPCLAAYADCLAKCIALRDRGAVCLVARSGNPIVISHLRRKGCFETLKETATFPDGTTEIKWRFMAKPDAFKIWLEKFASKSPPSPS